MHIFLHLLVFVWGGWQDMTFKEHCKVPHGLSMCYLTNVSWPWMLGHELIAMTILAVLS